MVNPPFIVNLTSAEIRKLELAKERILSENGVKAFRRVQAILLSAKSNWTVKRIATHFNVSQRIIWKWFKIYKEKGIEGLKGKYFSHKL